jgi:peptidyl-prolyl cis-trans isomerase C
VATVNGRPIPVEKVYSVYRMNKTMLQQRGRTLNDKEDQALRAQSLEAVLADELLHQAALAKGVTIAAPVVDAAVKQLKARAGSVEAYNKFLADSGLTEADVHGEVERNMRTEAYTKSLVAGKGVSDEQAKKFYDANAPKGMFNVPEQVHVQNILLKATEKDTASVRIDASKRAEEAAKRAASGEDFTALAKQYSQDSSSARGGDLGFVPRGVLFPNFEELAFSMKPGEVSAVFETPKGFNVIKVLEKKPESTRSYDEVKNALKADMGRLMEQDDLKVKIQELAAAAKIAILDPSFARPPQAVSAASPPVKP